MLVSLPISCVLSFPPGYVCEEHNNPADFFLDVLNGNSTAVQGVTDIANEARKDV